MQKHYPFHSLESIFEILTRMKYSGRVGDSSIGLTWKGMFFVIRALVGTYLNPTHKKEDIPNRFNSKMSQFK
jgi:hypothetical protein